MVQRVDIQRIARQNGQPPRVGGFDLCQGGQTAFILFNRQHPPRTFRKKPTGEAARTWADLQYVMAGVVARQPRDLSR